MINHMHFFIWTPSNLLRIITQSVCMLLLTAGIHDTEPLRSLTEKKCTPLKHQNAFCLESNKFWLEMKTLLQKGH